MGRVKKKFLIVAGLFLSGINPLWATNTTSINSYSKQITLINKKRTCSWVVGKLVENELIKTSNRLNQIKNLTIYLYGLSSPYWGQEQVVTGLLTGKDLLEGLQGKELGEELLLPSVMLRQGEKIFLDDMTLQELCSSLNVSIRIVHDAEDIVNGALGKA